MFINPSFIQSEISEIKSNLNSITDKVSDLSSPPNQVILTNKELCELMKVCSKTAQKWRDEGKVSYSKIGREIFYKLSDVLSMLDNHRNEAIH